IFVGVYYFLQRLLKARMYNDFLSNLSFWGWQLVIISAVITLPLGYSSSKEYAELEWPIDIAIAIVWVAFGLNMIMTILRRRERHLYVAIWFYLGTFVRSEEHTSELQSRENLVCRLLLEKKKKE